MSASWKRWTEGERRFKKFPFAEKAQPNLGNITTKLEFFQLFFTNELFEAIAKESIGYAQQKMQPHKPFTKGCRWRTWFDITAIELKAFIAVILNVPQ